MYPSYTISIIDGHHYVDMNPYKTIKNITYTFKTMEGETIAEISNQTTI